MSLIKLPFTLSSLRKSYASGVKPIDVVGEVYQRIQQLQDPAIFIYLRPKEDVVAEANLLPAESHGLPLWGIPFVVKDNINVEGLPTTAACPDYSYIADKDAFVVEKLRKAGALLIGKANLDQFATGLVGVRSPYGVPRNATDPELIPGGSSSGSAVAVAQKLVVFSLGTDTAGSGRVPAALNNIVGLKPSLGSLSASGVVPACRTLDTLSIFAQNVEDAYEIFENCCEYDHNDAYSKQVKPGKIGKCPSQFKVGVPDKATRIFFGDSIQAENFEQNIERMKSLGAVIEEIDFSPFYAVAHMLYKGAWVAERYTVIEELLRNHPEALHEVTKKVIGAANQFSAADAFRGMYRLKELESIAKSKLAMVDLLCVPSIPTFYTLKDLEHDPMTPNNNLGTYTNFVNLLDLCALTVPSSCRSDRKPGSVTFIASAGRDSYIATIGQAFMGKQADHHDTEISKDEFKIAVCGAHMSGMPLNHELVSRGARFLEATYTLPNYRLYALPGGPPHRPGLIRVKNGSAIEVEVWALPKGEVGGFMEYIPSPLTIGTIYLENGQYSHGFLVESDGVGNADDISHLGSWRKFQLP